MKFNKNSNFSTPRVTFALSCQLADSKILNQNKTSPYVNMYYWKQVHLLYLIWCAHGEDVHVGLYRGNLWININVFEERAVSIFGPEMLVSAYSSTRR